MQEMPVYLFTGFLEAGKTSFIKETLADKRFHSGQRTLLLLCEAGETCDETLDLPAGSNYLYMELNGYTGVAALTVEDAAEEP